MKKLIITIILVLLGILTSASYTTVKATESYEISMPERLDISENRTEFTVTFESDIPKDSIIRISYPKNILLTNSNKETFPAVIESDNDRLKAKGDKIVFIITHENLPEGNWKFDLDVTFTSVKNGVQIKTDNKTIESAKQNADSVSIERKTMYSYQDVYEWDMANYSLEQSANTKALTQYSYETAEFSNSNYVYDIPADGMYLSKTLYGYKERTKEKIETPYTYTNIRHYNAYGSCPLDCDSGTVNFYGTGCECTITEHKKDIRVSYNYGEWVENENSYRFDESYTESDTVALLEKTVYLLPVSYIQSGNWTYEELSQSNTQRVLTRTVYVSVLRASDASELSDIKPDENENRIITSTDYCRIVTNGKAGEWKPCA